MIARNMTLAALMFLSSATWGNGGPVDMSHIAATGNLRLQNHPDVRLLSEELLIAVELDHVAVKAVYLLRNDGDAVELIYCFPVDRFISGEFESEEDDIVGFRITANGVELSPGSPLAEDTLLLEIEGMMHSGTALRTWLPAELCLEAGSETTLEVSYSVRPCFMDWETSKGFFFDYSYRYFRYLLDPSGRWGDGRADEFSCVMDFRQLLENGGEVVSLPETGEWGEPGIYRITAAGFDLASAKPLEVVYDPGTWKRSDDMRRLAVPRESIRGLSSCEILAPVGGNTYEAGNMFDSNRNTAWAVPLHEAGPVPWMGVELAETDLGCVAIIGGYAKSEEAWNDNARVRGVRVKLFLRGTCVDQWECELPDQEYPGNAPLAEAAQVIYQTGMPGPVDSLSVEITSVHPGRLYGDLCISEMVLSEW